MESWVLIGLFMAMLSLTTIKVASHSSQQIKTMRTWKAETQNQRKVYKIRKTVPQWQWLIQLSSVKINLKWEIIAKRVLLFLNGVASSALMWFISSVLMEYLQELAAICRK